MQVINYINIGEANAKTADVIAGEMTRDLKRVVTSREVRQEIKANRNHLIIWNNKGSYIETDRHKVKTFVNKRVTSSMYGYITGMNNLSNKLGEETNLVLNKVVG